MRKCAAAMMTLLLLFLAACGAAKPSAAGRYICTDVGSDDSVPMSRADIWLQLEEDGSGVFCMDEEKAVTWRLDGTQLLLTTPEETCEGVLNNGVLTLEISGETFLMTRVELIPEELPAVELVPAVIEQALQGDTQLQRDWNGNWYGWWEMHGTTGGYTESEGLRRDLCARVELDSSGSGTVNLWDEEHSPDDPLGTVQITVKAADGKSIGTAASESGFFAGDVLKYGDWVIEPDLYQYEDLVVIEGACADDKGTYNYSIFLRPWGRLWDDIEAVESEQLPYGYFDWYLPALEDGAAMPDRVGGAWVPGSQGVANDPTGKTASVMVADGHAALVYSTARYRSGEGDDLSSLDGGVRFYAIWCAGEETAQGYGEAMTARRCYPDFTEQEFYVGGYPARRVSYYDSDSRFNAIEYLIDVSGSESGAAVYLLITLEDTADTAAADAVVSTFQLQ